MYYDESVCIATLPTQQCEVSSTTAELTTAASKNLDTTLPRCYSGNAKAQTESRDNGHTQPTAVGGEVFPARTSY